MLRSPSSSVSSPACALSPPEVPSEGPSRKNEGFGKAYQHYLAEQGPVRNPYQNQRPRNQSEQQQPDHHVNNDWRSGSYDSSNTSWESDWSASRGGTIKSESPNTTAFYKYRNNTGSYQSGTDWSGDPPTYGVMQHSQQSSSNSPSASSSSYYDSNDYYGYSSYDQNARGGPTGYQQQYGSMSQQPYQTGNVSGAYNGNRNPSSCPPTPGKQQEYFRRHTRYGAENAVRTQIKREPDADGGEMEGDNFTSLFTKSLTSLYSQDTENAYGDDSKTYDSDIMICTPSGSVTPFEDNSYQRLGPPPPGQYNPGYQNMRNNFGFYENRPPNSEPSVVQELGSGPERSNSFRYDRPSFDDMHLYASNPPETKSQAKKRKLSMPNIGPEGGNYSAGDNRRKASRGMTFKSEAKWTPNSFAFGDVQIKQEPLDDYTTEDLDSQNRNMMQYKDGTTGNGNGVKNSGQQSDHVKAPPRKRSPASTCFDRFEKKSTPQSKKVSPLSVYAKVQECVVLNVKCRRYKKRTKPGNVKEEVVYPGKEEVENWKRTGAYGESPDQAVRHLMRDMLEKVSHIGIRPVDTSGPDLSQLDIMKVRELLYQFCQRYSLDYRDFEDIDSVLRPNIMKDKTAKNSIRASAIRKRTSVSPVRPKQVPEPETKPPKTEKVVKKTNTDAPKPAERRILRSLPGRVDRSRQPRRRMVKSPVVRRRYSTRSAKDVEETNHSDVDIIIDSSTDRESEAGKEAEVRKKSQRLKNKQPVEMPAREKPSTKVLRNTVKKEEPRTRSREKREAEKLKDIAKATPKKKWSRLHITNSENSLSSSGDSVEIISSNSPSPKILIKESKVAIKIEPLPSIKSLTATKTSERISNRMSKQNEESQGKISKIVEDCNNNSSKQAENSNSKTSKSLMETTVKIFKLKEQPSKNAKTEETLNNRTSSRISEKIVSQIKTKTMHLMGRRGRAPEIERQPVLNDEHSSRSKDDNESPSKTNDKASEKTISKQIDMSSDESKSSISEPENSVSDNKIDTICPKSATITKDMEQTKKEFKIFENAPNLNSDSDKKESWSSNISSKSNSVEKTKDVTRDREQNPEKPLKYRLFSERNESTLQIKLSRLPLKLDSKKRLIPIQSQDFFCSVNKPKPDLESSRPLEDKGEKISDLQEPPELVCMKEPEREKKEETGPKEESCSSKLSPTENGEPPANLVANITEPITNTIETNVPTSESEVIVKPCPITRPRYSESEDSDCGLIIDLDRRVSIEERVPSPTFQIVSKKNKERKELSLNDMTINLLKKEPAVTPPTDGTKTPISNNVNSDNEDDCILLPPSEDPLRLDSRTASFLENTASSFSLVDTDLEHAKKLKDQDESILRTLLLETADVANGVGQDLHCDATSDISADSKASISKDVMKLLMYQTYHDVSPLCSSGFDDKKIPIDQLTADVNSQLLGDEEFSRDPRRLREQIKKLRNELVYLQCMIDQKDKERTAIICFKRYKEEVLKRVMKQYAAIIQLRDLIRARQESTSSERSSSERSSSGRHAPVASTSSSSQPSLPSDSPHPQLSPSHQVLQLAYHATVKTDAPTSTITSASSKKSSSSCSESLPSVSAMIAKATENYGVDMRTMRNGSSTTQTILQKVLSSKESIYSPTACRSPSSDKPSTSKSTTHHQQQSVQIFQKTLSSSTREACFSPAHCRSPSLPELRPGPPKSTTPSHPQLLHKALSSKDPSPTSSRSPPSLQPELRPTKPSTVQSSSIQRTSSKSSDSHPIDLIVNPPDKLKMPSSKSYDSIPTFKSKGSPEANALKHSSSPKHSSSTSYSAWSSIHSRTSLSATTTTTIDMRTTDQHHSRKSLESVSLSKRTHNGSHSSSSQGFMVVPPPTTLQQSQKSSVVHQSRSDSSHPIEKSLKSSMEKIYSRKTEEERRTMTFSSSVLTTGNSLKYSNSHKTMPPATITSSSIKAIAPPSPAPQTSPPRCMGCGLSQAKFLCSGCRNHWYCSHECQGMVWPDHSRTCVGNIGVFNQSPGTSYS